MSIAKALAEKKRFVPAAGYNVVGVDAYAELGESALYLIDHVDTREAAERIVARAKPDGDKRYVYPAKGAK